jgi:pimeloyl-ACP methyl ester carboxylesterase
MADEHCAVAPPVPVELREVEVDGASIRYRVAGSGEPLVLLHGLSGSWRWWQPILEPLAKRRCVHLLDLPRLGPRLRAAEVAGWLGRWLDQVGLRCVDIGGHSLGGLYAAEFAADQPERLRRLILVAPAGIPCGRSFLSHGLPLLGALYDVRGRLPTVVGDALRAGPFSLLRGAAFVSARDLREDLASVRSPTLLAWGERDRLVPTRMAEDWHRGVNGSRLVHLPSGHVPMWEAPGELAAAVIDFLGEDLAD